MSVSCPAASQIEGWVVLSSQTFISHLLMADVFYNTIFQIDCTKCLQNTRHKVEIEQCHSIF